MTKRKYTLKNIALISTLSIMFSTSIVKANSSFERISGKNRYETAAAISKHGWEKSQYAVIAQGENFPDALCSVPLAKKYNAPILLTSKDKLHENVEEEIKRLKVKNIIIIGGEGAISSKLEESIKNNFKDVTVERIAGKDRYETSVKIAQKLDFNGEVVLASSKYYADALSIAPIAAKKGMPIILTGKDKLSTSAKNYLKDKNINNSYVIGGTGVIENSILKEVKNSTRIYGKNRFETNMEILKKFENDIDYTNTFAALGCGPNGNEFADALSGAALAAKMNGPIILSNKDLPEVTKDYLQTKLTGKEKIFALGGESVLPSKAVNKILNKKDETNKEEDKNAKPNAGGSGGGTSSGGASGGGGSSTQKGPEVTKVYLKGADGTIFDGEVKSSSISVNVPKEYKENITNIVVTASEDIVSAQVAGKKISKEEIEKLYGNNRNEMDLIQYIRYKGFDKEKDGLEISNVKLLNDTSIILRDGNKNSTIYKLIIK